MCLIIDTSLSAMIFQTPTPKEFSPILKWLNSRKGQLVIGGKNRKEICKVGKALENIAKWKEAGGIIREFSDNKVEAEEKSLPKIRSNDPHVIALARISRARTLCAEDKELEADFTNTKIIPSPQGMIYKNENHAHLLKHTQGCPGYRKKGRKHS
ncbi:MAG: hypothetical protein HZA50_03865 [Planctomycetes bacterium]|nr:hypothetical protein [Planctomycetota bacterium]